MSVFDQNCCSARFDIAYAEAYGWSTVSKRISEVFVNKFRVSGHRAVHIDFDRRSHVSLVLGFGNKQEPQRVVF